MPQRSFDGRSTIVKLIRNGNFLMTDTVLPPGMNWAHRMLSQSSASSLLHWSCAHWLKRVASVLSDVTLSVATLRAESWALIRVLRSARLWLPWLLSPPLVRATNNRPALMFQPSCIINKPLISDRYKLGKLCKCWRFLQVVHYRF